MRKFVFALPLGALLVIASAPVAFADEPTPLDVALPEGTNVCVGENAKVVLTYTARIERTSTDLQLSDGASVLIQGPDVGPQSDTGSISLAPLVFPEITLPDDWTSQPEGTLSDGFDIQVELTGSSVGTVPSQTFRWEVTEQSPTEQVQEFEGTVDGFDVIDCTATPAPIPVPTPTTPPSDTVSTSTANTDLTAAFLALVALAATALILVPRRRRRA